MITDVRTRGADDDRRGPAFLTEWRGEAESAAEQAEAAWLTSSSALTAAAAVVARSAALRAEESEAVAARAQATTTAIVGEYQRRVAVSETARSQAEHQVRSHQIYWGGDNGIAKM
jgi:hypothetical protein